MLSIAADDLGDAGLGGGGEVPLGAGGEGEARAEGWPACPRLSL